MLAIIWEELTSANYISAVLLEISLNEYYIFGASKSWVEYTANDYDRRLNIIGLKTEFFFFSKYFEQSKEEK